MAVGQDEVEQILALSRAIGAETESDVIFFAGSIYGQEEKSLRDLLRNQEKRQENVLFIFATLGGSPDCGYRICRMLQRAYSKGTFTIFVPSFCKSAGTLVVMGADELMMTSSAELGPLDVQLVSRDLAERTSGLTPAQALTTLRVEVSTAFEEVFLHIRKKTRLASESSAEVAGQIVSNLFKEVYGKIDPMKLGENDRSMLVAQNYAERLSKGRHLLQRKAISKLITGYPSHEFVIDRKEAGELFRDIRYPKDKQFELALLLQPIIETALFDDEANFLIQTLSFSDGEEEQDEKEEEEAESAEAAPQEGTTHENNPKDESTNGEKSGSEAGGTSAD